jgi:hypothetical protein
VPVRLSLCGYNKVPLLERTCGHSTVTGDGGGHRAATTDELVGLLTTQCPFGNGAGEKLQPDMTVVALVSHSVSLM